ncbi:SHOCT domain-containing protein [Carnobacterium sp. ISL-102]|uniref:SHOCT domain-containing protein n=1 Tax=Carnobacterium sp. ISL-102 TaxID=2819142 RepID=UPI001BEC5BAB|nr:SHOCT domain-containing protein [Carnobacterium sp. ISL-102]MBT2732980.1 SHOCT domain-containing protein [Carnobacterium sp. ISL-102]
MFECFNFFSRGGMGSMIYIGFFWILLLVVVVLLGAKLFFNQQNKGNDRETPLEVLQKEYAKGNISEEEYLERKKHLQ